MQRARLALPGVVDLAAAPELGAQLAEVARGEGDVVVDARRLSFIDVGGCRTLVEAARRLPEGRRLVVVGAPPSLVRLLRICGWGDVPELVVLPRRRSRVKG